MNGLKSKDVMLRQNLVLYDSLNLHFFKKKKRNLVFLDDSNAIVMCLIPFQSLYKPLSIFTSHSKTHKLKSPFYLSLSLSIWSSFPLQFCCSSCFLPLVCLIFLFNNFLIKVYFYLFIFFQYTKFSFRKKVGLKWVIWCRDGAHGDRRKDMWISEPTLQGAVLQ